MRVSDLFAGWGGFSEGAEAAGCDVVYASNHWDMAIKAHELNHPTTKHVLQDLCLADWNDMPEYEMLIASPACQGHSSAAQPARAKSKRIKIHHGTVRATAWSVVDCAEVTEPRAIIVENVPEFRNWKRFDLWKKCFESMGYFVQHGVYCGVNHQVPQRRNRLFVIMTKKKINIKFSKSKNEPAFGPHIEWDEGKWQDARKTTPAVKKRINAGRRRFGKRFIIQHVTGHRGIGLHEPLRTITTKNQWAVVDGDRYRTLIPRETARGMSFPDTFKMPDCSDTMKVIGLGNAVPPNMAKDIVRRVAENI